MSEKLTRGSFLGNCFKAVGALILGERLSVRPVAAEPAPPSPKNPLPFGLKEEGRFDTGIQKLAGIAVDAKDRIYAAGVKGVKVFESSGKLAREIATPAPATCVALGSDGSIYVGHRGIVEGLDSEGRRQWAWGEGEKEGAQEKKGRVYYTSLALDGAYLYAADAGSRSLKRFTIDGDFVDEIGGFEIPSPFFKCAADGKGKVFVANTGRFRIETYDRNCKLQEHWGRFGTDAQNFCGCCNPTSFAIFPDGKVVTTEKGIPRLKVYGADHQLIAYLGKEAFPEGVAGMDVVIDSKSRIVLSEPKKGEIRIYKLADSAAKGK